MKALPHPDPRTQALRARRSTGARRVAWFTRATQAPPHACTAPCALTSQKANYRAGARIPSARALAADLRLTKHGQTAILNSSAEELRRASGWGRAPSWRDPVSEAAPFDQARARPWRRDPVPDGRCGGGP